jgi:NitT/TauT family transport system ATP-binding protein
VGFELDISHVSHRFGSILALDDIEANIREGEVLAIVGPSGCGKSTLLGILGGLLQPSKGAVLVRGAFPAGALNPLAYVFQDFALLPWRTVTENVRLVLEHHELSRKERNALVADALARVGLQEFAAALPKQLSGGMRQRVGIARALVGRPAVLLMDEPLSALDAQTRELLMEDFIAMWSAQNTTAAYVTHNVDEALRLADRIMILRRRPGRIKMMVTIPIPRAERGKTYAERDLRRIHDELWQNIREEARIADREIEA